MVGSAGIGGARIGEAGMSESGEAGMSDGDSAGAAGVGDAVSSGGCDGSAVGSIETRIRYLLASADDSAECQPETQYRTCTGSAWGSWSGLHLFEECRVDDCPALPETRVRFLEATANYPAVCLREVQFRNCSAGVSGAWTGTFSHELCVNQVKACGATGHGSSETRTRYREQQLAFGGSCESEEQSRLCINGEFLPWSGRFQQASCDVAGPAACDTSSHGTIEERTRYAQAVVADTKDCVSEKQTRTCSNGVWSSWSGTATFSQATCRVQLGGSCQATNECVEGACNSVCACAVHEYQSMCGTEPCCKCSTHWTGDTCQTCPGHFDALNDCNSCKNHWTGNDCALCPAQFSPESDCTACSPGWSGPNCQEQAVCVRFVDSQNKASWQTGYSWSEAFSSLSTALASVVRSKSCQFWVRAGTYLDQIDTDSNHAIYGGFAGTELSLSERDPKKNVVVVTGGLRGGAMVDGVTFKIFYLQANQRLTLRRVTLSGENVNVTVGNAPLLIEDSSFENSYCAVGVGYGAQAIVRRSRFSGVFGGQGAAIASWSDIPVVVEDSIFLDNFVHRGGLFNLKGGELKLVNSVVARNQGVVDDSPLFAVYPGLGTGYPGVVTITNSTIVENSAKEGMLAGPAFEISGKSKVQVFNSILWANSGQVASILWPESGQVVSPANTVIRSSIVEGGFVGAGNFSAQPSFVGTGSDPYRLTADSPGIDAADGDRAPSHDLSGALRFDAPVANTGSGTPSYADIGAYEWH
jgi:hypothetical protein